MRKKQNNERGKEQPTHGYTERFISEFQTAPAIIGRIVSLIDEGNTIPFIARYRKEMTGAMDDQSCARSANGWIICAGWISAARRLPRPSRSRAR